MQKLNSIETYMKKRRILQHAMFVISKISKQLKGAHEEESCENSYEEALKGEMNKEENDCL